MEEERYYEDEISLKELIIALVKNWKLIAAITLACVLIASGYLFLVADEVYEATIEGTISVPESASTRYGSYSLPTTNKMDYLNMIKSNSVVAKTLNDLELEEASDSGFSNSITIETEEDSTRFSLIVTGPSPDAAILRINTLVENYLQEIKVYFKENAINKFISALNRRQDTLLETKEYNEMHLVQLEEDFTDVSPVITLQKLMSSDPLYAAEIAKDRGIRLEDVNDEMMYEEVINPHYSEIQGEIIGLRKSLQNIERSLKRDGEHLEELKSEKVKIDRYHQTGDFTDAHLEVMDVINSNIQFASSPSYNDSPIEPRKLLILAISLVLGGMLGVFAAFFKEYWENAE